MPELSKNYTRFAKLNVKFQIEAIVSEKEAGKCAELQIPTFNTTLTLGYLILTTMTDHFNGSSTHGCSQFAFYIVLFGA